MVTGVDSERIFQYGVLRLKSLSSLFRSIFANPPENEVHTCWIAEHGTHLR